MINKKNIMCGNHEAGFNIVSYLLDNGVTFDYFVLLPNELGVKYQISGFVDFSILAKKYKIPIYYVKSFSLKDKEDIAFFKKHNFDILIQGGWQRLFPDEILETLNVGGIGVHGSSDFLPRGRGRSPLNWSLIEGKKRFIMHLFLMKAGVDNGDIFDYDQFDINEHDTIQTLYMKNAIITKRMLLRSIQKIADGSVVFRKQEGDSSYYNKRNPDDGKVNWMVKDVDQICNLIRALSKPYPGAFSYIKRQKIYLWKAQVFDRSIKYLNSEYGEIVEIFGDKQILINCLSGLLLVTKFSIEGDIKVGDILGEE